MQLFWNWTKEKYNWEMLHFEMATFWQIFWDVATLKLSALSFSRVKEKMKNKDTSIICVIAFSFYNSYYKKLISDAKKIATFLI